MITHSQLETLAGFPTASWALWSSDFDKESCLESDLTRLHGFFNENINRLKNDVVLLGLNPSSQKWIDGRHDSPCAFQGFHLTRKRTPRCNDWMLKEYIQDNQLTYLVGSYMTDIESSPESDSSKVIVTAESIASLQKQLELLGAERFTVICFGRDSFTALLNTVSSSEISWEAHRVIRASGILNEQSLQIFGVYHYSGRVLPKYLRELRPQLEHINHWLSMQKHA